MTREKSDPGKSSPFHIVQPAPSATLAPSSTISNRDHLAIMQPNPDNEIFDVVDENDNVVRQASRTEVHREGWLHRSVQIWIFRSDGRMLIHQRSAKKDEAPLLWSSSVAGHVDSGETYEQAAERELMEEMCLFGDLEWLHTFPAEPETANEFTAFFRARIETMPVADPDEVEAWEYLTFPEIAADVEAHPEKYTNIFRKLIVWYADHVSKT